MDPNLFYVDLDRVGEALIAVIVLAFIVERALATVFEHEWYINRFDEKGYKSIIAFLVSFLVCFWWDFDLVSFVVLTDRTQFLGYVITGAVIAGGSKGAMKLFHDVMGIKSSARTEKDAETAYTRLWTLVDNDLKARKLTLSPESEAELRRIVTEASAQVATNPGKEADAVKTVGEVVKSIADNAAAANRLEVSRDDVDLAVAALPVGAWPLK